MKAPRVMEPEWLDELPPDDPRARRSRRDLRRINALMMNDRFVARELRRIFPVRPPRSIVEIGAGDGTFMLKVASRLAPAWRTVDAVLLDQQDLVEPASRAEYAAMGWQVKTAKADVFAWLAEPAAPVFDVMIANLFLHHFDAGRLPELLTHIARRARVLIACEPQRSGRALLGSRLLGAIGCNDVSRHDAVVSVRAGFRKQELSELWPATARWAMREYACGLFSHCFVAIREDGSVATGQPDTR